MRSLKRKSKLAIKIENLIKQSFPNFRYITEYSIKVEGSFLYFDYFIPELNLFIEVNGQQHYNFILFFHKNKMSFADQKYRDILKNQWVIDHKLKLLSLSYEDIPNLTAERFRQLVINIL